MKKILISSAILLVFASCEKSDTTSTCSLSSTALVGTYKITALSEKDSPTSPSIDKFSSINACVKDNMQTFTSDGLVTIIDAGIVCSPSSDFLSTWSLSGNYLIVLDVLGERAGVVSDFSCRSFKLTYSNIGGKASTYTFTRQ